MFPHSDACERNKGPILEILREVFAGCTSILEIGSGTGQHAVYFARHMPHIFWQTSELLDNHPGIAAWLGEASLPNVTAPLTLDVENKPWPMIGADAVFTANTVHIISWPQVEALFSGVGAILPEGGVFALYGPFNYGGRFTSESNARFDLWLKSRDPLSGVRDFEALDALARTAGLILTHDYEMPANNRTLVWCKQ